MVYDARYNTKVFLTDGTKGIQDANILKDDGMTQATWIVAYGYPNYPVERVFFGTKNVDLLVALIKPRSLPLFGASFSPWGYEEHLPVHVRAPTKQGITGTKLMWQGEAEVRRILQNNPLGSRRYLGESRPIRDEISDTIPGVEFTFSYRRNII
jgi:hypothetical protein